MRELSAVNSRRLVDGHRNFSRWLQASTWKEWRGSWLVYTCM